MDHIEEMRAEIFRMNTVVGSAIELFGLLATKIEQLADDPAQIRELAGQVRAQADALAAAVVANTPSG